MKNKMKFLELFFVLYLMSGFVKSFMNYFNINFPIDVTILSGGVILIISLKRKRVRIKKQYLITLLTLMAFYIWINTSIIYTSSEKYWLEKSILFLLNIFAFIVPVFNYKNFDIKKFLVM